VAGWGLLFHEPAFRGGDASPIRRCEARARKGIKIRAAQKILLPRSTGAFFVRPWVIDKIGGAEYDRPKLPDVRRPLRGGN
jgi:hypothetical protein